MPSEIRLMRGKELVDEGLAVVMNHRAAHAAVVVLMKSNDAPASVALMFGDHDFLVPVLVALAVHGFAARGTLVLEGARWIHRHPSSARAIVRPSAFTAGIGVSWSTAPG